MSRNNAITKVVSAHDRFVVHASFQSLGNVVHEDELRAAFRDLTVCASRSYRVGGNRYHNIGVLGEYCLDVGDLLTRVEVRVGDRDNVDA